VEDTDRLRFGDGALGCGSGEDHADARYRVLASEAGGGPGVDGDVVDGRVEVVLRIFVR
jgi:hypothetical protein